MIRIRGEFGNGAVGGACSNGLSAGRPVKSGTNLRVLQKLAAARIRDLGLCRSAFGIWAILGDEACRTRKFVPDFGRPTAPKGLIPRPYAQASRVGMACFVGAR